MLSFSPYFKFMVWAIFILSGIALLVMYVLPQGATTPGNRSNYPPLPTETVVLKGTVKDFASNRSGDIDQLIISTADGEKWVHFPPHTARRVMQTAPKGMGISVVVKTGPPHPPGPQNNAIRYQLEQIQTGDAILSIADIPPPPPAAGEPIELNGTIDSLVTGGREEVIGFVVNGYRVVLPPHLSQSVAPLLHVHKPILIKGYERNKNDGFVNKDQHSLIKPYRMTIDSTDYLL